MMCPGGKIFFSFCAPKSVAKCRRFKSACLSPDLTELVRASKHFNSQFESIRKLAADQWGVNKSALAAFQSSIKAVPTLAMPSVRLRPKRLASVSEEYWLGIDRDVIAVSRSLFDDGHFAQAVFEAVKRFDNEVKEQSVRSGGRDLSGVALMSEAFSPKQPVLTVADCSTATGQDIQQGTMFLSLGIMLRIRNPLGHENITLSLDEAKDWIVFISRLMKDLKRAPLW
jgi:uncharacterized protein (TIGR02391 family)